MSKELEKELERSRRELDEMSKELQRMAKESEIRSAQIAHQQRVIQRMEYQIKNQKAIHKEALKKKKTFLVQLEGLGLSGDRKQNAVNALAYTVSAYVIENEPNIPIYNTQFLDDECTQFELTVAFLDRFHI